MRRDLAFVLILGLFAWPAPARAAALSRLLILNEAISTALERNPDVAEAQSRLAEATARLEAARAIGQPWIRARAAYDYWSMDQRLFPATRNGEPGVFGPHAVGAEIVVSIPLYTGGRVSAEADAADWLRAAASAQVTRIQEVLVFQVTALFYGLLAQEEVLRSLEAAVEAMDEQQRTTHALVDAGKAARVDLLRANVRRAELYERQLRERNNRTVQQRAWAALLGLDDVAAPEAQGILEPREHPECLGTETCIEKALRQRPDYRAAQDVVAATEASVRAARAGSRPTLSAQASYGGRWTPDVTDEPVGADRQEALGRIGLVAEIPLFDGHMTASRVAEQQARLRGAQERLRKLELQIRYEVETVRSEIAAAHERVQTSGQAVGQAEESFRIMKEKYDLGKGTLTDVLDVQAALVIAQTSYARALADLAVADAQRRLATGEMLP